MALLRYMQLRDGPDTFLGKCHDYRSILLYCNSVLVCNVPWFLFARKNFANSYFPNIFIYVVAVNTASSLDSTIFHAFLTCSVLVCEPGNEAIALSESTYCKKFLVGSPNHKNILHKKLKQKFYNTKISRSTVRWKANGRLNATWNSTSPCKAANYVSLLVAGLHLSPSNFPYTPSLTVMGVYMMCLATNG